MFAYVSSSADVMPNTSLARCEEIHSEIKSVLQPLGFECYPFKIGWYNDNVSKPFVLDYPYDTLAFIVISTPAMFDKAFKPYIIRKQCTNGHRDPIDQCVQDQFQHCKQMFPEQSVDVIHDFELHYSRRPKVLVQTAGHVAGAAYYYQRKDVRIDPWSDRKKVYGVSVHPKYGGWFALRGVLIFGSVECTYLPMRRPPDVIPDDEGRIELLNRFNGNWKDWTFRDMFPVKEKYSDEQKQYFATMPKDRRAIIEQYLLEAD